MGSIPFWLFRETSQVEKASNLLVTETITQRHGERQSKLGAAGGNSVQARSQDRIEKVTLWANEQVAELAYAVREVEIGWDRPIVTRRPEALRSKACRFESCPVRFTSEWLSGQAHDT